MRAADWAGWAAVVLAIFSAVAAGVAAWNVTRTRTDLRLQLASDFVSELAAWGVGVLEYQARAIPLFIDGTPHEARQALAGSLYNDLNFHITKGGFYVGAAESEPVRVASRVLERLRTYHERLTYADLDAGENETYLKVFDQFVNAMRVESGLKRRYEIAQRALR